MKIHRRLDIRCETTEQLLHELLQLPCFPLSSPLTHRYKRCLLFDPRKLTASSTVHRYDGACEEGHVTSSATEEFGEPRISPVTTPAEGLPDSESIAYLFVSTSYLFLGQRGQACCRIAGQTSVHGSFKNGTPWLNRQRVHW